MTDRLGRLERVTIRDVWADEAASFTPWLASEENLALLGETIGIELELEAQEKWVGPFRADILCKDLATDDWVLIENQLERTDHRHLGQLLTYAAGLKAVRIIWIATRFTEEHRAALDWLNEITDIHFSFFGIEVEAWRIGDSAIAPKFNLVSKPNDWSKAVAEEKKQAELTDTRKLQLEFWHAFRDYAEEHAKHFRPTKPLPQTWMGLAVGRSGFGLAAVASMWNSEHESYDVNEIRAEFNIYTERSGEYLSLLESQRGEIESELGYELEWPGQTDTRQKRICVRRTAHLEDRESWADLVRWLTRHLDDFRRVFEGRVRELTLS
jgi:hypothetical protein